MSSGLRFLLSRSPLAMLVAALACDHTTAESASGALLLVGDGSPTGTGVAHRRTRLEVEAIRMARIQPGMARVRRSRRTEPPCCRRQVWLRCGGQAWPWAESLVEKQTEAENKVFRDGKLPIGAASAADGLNCFASGWAGTGASELAAAGFAEERPYWSATTAFSWRQGTHRDREVFAAGLEHWLGSSSSRPNPRRRASAVEALFRAASRRLSSSVW